MGSNKKQMKILYLRLPKRIEEELQVKELHPDIIKVRLARQKSARWCHIEFEDQEKCLNALKELKNLTVEGKKVFVSLAKSHLDSSDYIKFKTKKKLKQRSN